MYRIFPVNQKKFGARFFKYSLFRLIDPIQKGIQPYIPEYACLSCNKIDFVCC